MRCLQPDFLERFFPSVLADVLADGESELLCTHVIVKMCTE